MITIIDYGAGNIGSIVNMIRKIGSEVKVSSNKEDILLAEFMVIWEIKDNKLYRGFQMSQIS